MAAEQSPAPVPLLQNNIFSAAIRDIYNAFQQRRDALGLSNPGTVENISREVQRDVLVTNFMFQGLRADLTKAFSISPVFQISHNLSMGSQAMPPYQFGALFGNPSVFLQGGIDNDGQMNGIFNYRWTSALVSKSQMQLAPDQAMLSFENVYTGKDFSASIKSINPSLMEGGLTGLFMASYLQSVTPSLALGVDAVWQRQGLDRGPDTAVSYSARYKKEDWILSGQYAAQGILQTSFWRRITEKVEAGVDMNLQFAPGLGPRGGGMMGAAMQKEGSTSVGAKYTFRNSTFRAQVDSTGRVGCVLERRVATLVNLTFAGEIDQPKKQAKIGLAVSIEAAGDDILEQQEKAMGGDTPTPPPY
ncbi:MAG: translocase of outer mitochondrial membrane [Cirrosporium novae-zelandiae]|nr:MAG: translocase of outer mitochondrial membrane [Cirrosporium novae-zelandiae]